MLFFLFGRYELRRLKVNNRNELLLLIFDALKLLLDITRTLVCIAKRRGERTFFRNRDSIRSSWTPLLPDEPYACSVWELDAEKVERALGGREGAVLKRSAACKGGKLSWAIDRSQSCREQWALCFSAVLSRNLAKSLRANKTAAITTTVQRRWDKIRQNYICGVNVSWDNYYCWRQGSGFENICKWLTKEIEKEVAWNNENTWQKYVRFQIFGWRSKMVDQRLLNRRWKAKCSQI